MDVIFVLFVVMALAAILIGTSFELVSNRARRMEVLLGRIHRKGEKQMALVDEIRQRVATQTTIIESVKVLVESLKANQNDPVALQEIVTALDANNLALDVLDNTDSAEPGAPPA